MLASAYSFGYLISGFLFWIPDRLGRKKTVILSLTIAMTAETIMIFNSGYYVRMVCFFITGLFQLQNSVSYVWLYESVSERSKPTAVTIINAVYALPQPLMCLYIMFLTKDWFLLCFLALILGYVSLIICFFCPESP